jgi:hypothetical protein
VVRLKGIPCKADYEGELSLVIQETLLQYLPYTYTTPKLTGIRQAAHALTQDIQNSQTAHAQNKDIKIKKALLTKDMWLLIKKEVRVAMQKKYTALMEEGENVKIEQELWAAVDAEDFFDNALDLVELPTAFKEAMHIPQLNSNDNEEDEIKAEIQTEMLKQSKKIPVYLQGIDIAALKDRQAAAKAAAEAEEAAEEELMQENLDNQETDDDI